MSDFDGTDGTDGADFAEGPPNGLRVIDGGDVEAFSSDEAKAIASLRNGALRLDAGLAYITNPNGMSLADLAADSRFRGRVVLRTLERWSTADRWAERREKWLTNIATEFQKRVGSQLVQHRLAELDMLTEVRDIGMEYIRDPTVRPKSWGEAVKAVNETSARIDELTKEVQSDLNPAGGRPTDEAPPLPAGEADAAIAAILEARRTSNGGELTAGAELPAGPQSGNTEGHAEVLRPQQPEAPDSPS